MKQKIYYKLDENEKDTKYNHLHHVAMINFTWGSSRSFVAILVCYPNYYVRSILGDHI